jgi:type III restriction enzyme
MDNVVLRIREELHQMMIEGIKYEKIGDRIYEMTLFDDSDLEIYIDQFTHTVQDSSKTIYENYIPLDSGIETQFARDCESSEQIEFYFKLPYWFEIKTPIGQYRPDWAVVFRDEKKIYFVAETKSPGQELRGSEKLKIACGMAHFENFEDVVYKRVSTVSDLT